jgi:hypothetical protein
LAIPDDYLCAGKACKEKHYNLFRPYTYKTCWKGLERKNTTAYLGPTNTKSLKTLTHRENMLERLAKEKCYILFRPHEYKMFDNINSQGKYAGKACQGKTLYLI